MKKKKPGAGMKKNIHNYVRQKSRFDDHLTKKENERALYLRNANKEVKLYLRKRMSIIPNRSLKHNKFEYLGIRK